MSVEVAVFTRDLRVRDNPMLAAAVCADAIVPLFVLDEAMAAGWHGAPNRRRFLYESLRDLDATLRSLGAPLVVRHGEWVEEVAGIARAVDATRVHLARDVSGYARDRVRRLAARVGSVQLVEHPGVTVVSSGELRTGSGDAFKVFTPYYRRWLAAPWRRPVSVPERLVAVPDARSDYVPDPASVRDTARDVVAGGEQAALARLQRWASSSLAHYADRHDDLAADDTSRISAALHFGCLSPLEVAGRLRDRAGGEPFVRQLCWRDFYHQLLAARPELASRDLRQGGPWLDDDAGFSAWCAGHTGFPVVDAAMRQLLTEGFIHNRARMIVASLLTKDLAVDWRRGADWFMRHLVDGDVANNQLNWQWVAGTGTDTNPHRIYNPQRQSERFDPDGTYIRRYVAELASVPGAEIHDPSPETRARVGYPLPIVDHREAIEQYRARRRS